MKSSSKKKPKKKARKAAKKQTRKAAEQKTRQPDSPEEVSAPPETGVASPEDSISGDVAPPETGGSPTENAAPPEESLLGDVAPPETGVARIGHVFPKPGVDSAGGAPSAGADELRVQGLQKRFGKKEAVRGVEFSMHSGKVVSLLGPNGAGKTTVFYMIVGFVRPTSGQVFFNQTDITRLPMFKRARLGISYLPQEPSVFRKLTVEQNLLAVMEPQKSLSRRQRHRRKDQLLEELGLEAVRKQKAYTLSGGERRRTEIARALATDPRFLLLDEPFAGIDPRARYEIKSIVKHLSSRDIGVLITDHNERDTLEISHYSYLIHEGLIVVAGTKEEVAANETARHVYLGHDYRD